MRICTRHSLVVIVACLVLEVVGQAARPDLTPAGDIVLASATDGGIKANSGSWGDLPPRRPPTPCGWL
jgi:hypothetical protein